MKKNKMDSIKKAKKEKGCMFIIIIALIIIAALGIIILIMSKNLKSYDEFDFSGLDLSKIEDGTYTGSEDGGIIKVTVDVSIKDHIIQGITIVKHDCGKGKPAEVIVDDIVEKNSLEVDAISGATLSSNVIKVAMTFPQSIKSVIDDLNLQ